MAGIFTFFPWIKNEFYYESVWNCLCEENRSINILLRFFFFVVIILSCLLKGAILTYRTCGGNHIWSECEVVYNERFSLSLCECVCVFSAPPPCSDPEGCAGSVLPMQRQMRISNNYALICGAAVLRLKRSNQGFNGRPTKQEVVSSLYF